MVLMGPTRLVAVGPMVAVVMKLRECQQTEIGSRQMATPQRGVASGRYACIKIHGRLSSPFTGRGASRGR